MRPPLTSAVRRSGDKGTQVALVARDVVPCSCYNGSMSEAVGSFVLA